MKPNLKTESTADGKKKDRAQKRKEVIVIKGCGGHFNGVYDVDQLILKTMVFAFVVSLIALIFL